jgi:hypothetical protein
MGKKIASRSCVVHNDYLGLKFVNYLGGGVSEFRCRKCLWFLEINSDNTILKRSRQSRAQRTRRTNVHSQ